MYTEILCIFFLNFSVLNVAYLLIDNEACRIPNVTLDYHDRMDMNEVKCGERKIFVKKFSASLIRFTMTMNFNSCCFSFVKRSREGMNEDINLIFSTCLPFKNNSRFKLKEEFIQVQCQEPKYEDRYAIVKKQRRTKKRIRNSLNVILLGIDSMSRSRAHHSLPLTINYIKRKMWFDYKGYNKVGLHSFKNLIPLLSGNRNDFNYEDNSFRCADMFSCNGYFIWHAYQEAGYITAFGEDGSSTYMGFNSAYGYKPTNHYLRPISLKRERSQNGVVCNGQISTAQQILNYVRDFTTTYRKRMFFGYFWIKGQDQKDKYSHSQLDKGLFDLFSNMEYLNIMNNTIIILFSHNGMRHGFLTYTADAYYESRLPMLFIHLAKNYQSKEISLNMAYNQYQVISPFDLHITLKDILRRSVNDSRIKLRATGCKTCVSILGTQLENRPCSEAGITDEWCTCVTLTAVPPDNYGVLFSVVTVTNYIKSIPKMLPTKPCQVCRNLDVLKVTRIHQFFLNANSYFIIELIVLPQVVVFEVMVRKYYVSGKYKYEVISGYQISENNLSHLCLVDEAKNNTFWLLCVCSYDFECMELENMNNNVYHRYNLQSY